MLDQRKVRVEMLRKLDIPNPESWISAPPQAPPDEVPPSTLDFLQKAGVPAELIAESVRAAKADQQREQAQQPQGQPQLPPGQPAAA
jgi:hypothetical protein